MAGPNVLLTGAGINAIIDENNSPSLAVNPRQPRNLVVVNRVDRPQYSAMLHWSIDAGASWADTPLPLPPGRDRPYAPDTAFGPDGVLYVTYVNLEGRGNDPQTLWLARSTDGGRTLAPPVQVAGRFSFQARLATGPAGHVYVTWLRGSTVGLLALNEPAPVVTATSTDGGATFSAPVQVSDPGRGRVGAATPVVDGSGSVDVLYEDFKGDARDFLNLAGPTWDAPFALVIARSTDSGRSFSAGVEVDAGVIASERFLVYLPRFPSIAVGPGRSLYVAWAGARSGTDQVFVRRSSDGGATWSAAAVASVIPAGPAVSAWLPRASVAPNGRVDVLYLGGHRNAGDGRVSAYLSTSTDDGATFQAARVSSSDYDSRLGPLTGPAYLPPDLGGRLSLQSSDSGAMAAWVDTRLGTAATGRQDIVFTSVGVTRRTVSVVRAVAVAAMLALAISAVVLALRGRVRRPRTGR